MRKFLIFAGKRSHDGKKIYGQIVLVGNEYVILPFHVFDRRRRFGLPVEENEDND